MIPTHIALQLAAEHQREFENRAARRRLVNHLAITNCRTRRIDTVLPALRRIAATFPLGHRPTVVRAAVGPGSCCCA